MITGSLFPLFSPLNPETYKVIFNPDEISLQKFAVAPGNLADQNASKVSNLDKSCDLIWIFFLVYRIYRFSSPALLQAEFMSSSKACATHPRFRLSAGRVRWKN